MIKLVKLESRVDIYNPNGSMSINELYFKRTNDSVFIVNNSPFLYSLLSVEKGEYIYIFSGFSDLIETQRDLFACENLNASDKIDLLLTSLFHTTEFPPFYELGGFKLRPIIIRPFSEFDVNKVIDSVKEPLLSSLSSTGKIANVTNDSYDFNFIILNGIDIYEFENNFGPLISTLVGKALLYSSCSSNSLYEIDLDKKIKPLNGCFESELSNYANCAITPLVVRDSKSQVFEVDLFLQLLNVFCSKTPNLLSLLFSNLIKRHRLANSYHPGTYGLAVPELLSALKFDFNFLYSFLNVAFLDLNSAAAFSSDVRETFLSSSYCSDFAVSNHLEVRRLLSSSSSPFKSFDCVMTHIACSKYKVFNERPPILGDTILRSIADCFLKINFSFSTKNINDFCICKPRDSGEKRIYEITYLKNKSVGKNLRTENGYIYLPILQNEPFIYKFVIQPGFNPQPLFKNKHEVKNKLNRFGLRTPVGDVFNEQNVEDVLSLIESFESKTGVVKPLLGAGGNGITLGVRTRDDVIESFARLTSSKFVVEEQFEGDDFRFYVVGGCIVACALRRPGTVVGDGHKTLRELVNITSKARLSHPVYGDFPIILSNKLQKNIDWVPSNGQVVHITETANISQGGEPVDLTDDFHPTFQELAFRAWLSTDFVSDHFSMDVLVKDITKPAIEDNYVIIELNARSGHRQLITPLVGPGRNSHKAVVDYWFPD